MNGEWTRTQGEVNGENNKKNEVCLTTIKDSNTSQQQERFKGWKGGNGYIVMENVENLDIFMFVFFPFA